MKILLTGGSGFLGKNIVNYFKSVNSANPHLTYSVMPLGSNVYDLRDSYACKKALDHYNPDVIIHAAGSVGGIQVNKENPGKFMYDNLAMGMNMMERARQYRDRTQKDVKFIMLGTVCSYPKFSPVPFKEEDIWNGFPEETNAPYGVSKKALMMLADTYHRQYGMDMVNLIPVNMYGPHDHFNLTSSHVIPALILKFYNAMKNGEQEINVWGTGKASREFLYAEDCAKAIHAAIHKDVGSDPINIGTGQETTIKDLVTEVGEQMGFEGIINWQTDKPDGQPRRCLDTTKAKELLDFEATTELQTGLKHTIEWFLKKENK